MSGPPLIRTARFRMPAVEILRQSSPAAALASCRKRRTFDAPLVAHLDLTTVRRGDIRICRRWCEACR
jgi:hypothetical protein